MGNMRDLFEEEVLPLFEKYRAEWLAAARAHAVMIAGERGEVSADDIHDVCPLPPDIDPRVMGAVFKPDFNLVRYEKSRRTICHHRPIGVFKLKEAA
jgi:hypothetical protein